MPNNIKNKKEEKMVGCTTIQPRKVERNEDGSPKPSLTIEEFVKFYAISSSPVMVELAK